MIRITLFLEQEILYKIVYYLLIERIILSLVYSTQFQFIQIYKNDIVYKTYKCVPYPNKIRFVTLRE